MLALALIPLMLSRTQSENVPYKEIHVNQSNYVKTVNQTSDNQIYSVDMIKQKFNYSFIFVELYLPKRQQLQLYISIEDVPTDQNHDIYDQNGYDYNQKKSYELTKDYYNIYLDNTNQTIDSFLISVQGSDLQYNLSITQSFFRPCPRNCGGRGNCVNGTCNCSSGFIDEDCSVPARVVFLNQPLYLNFTNQDFQYFYFQEDFKTDPIKVIVSTKSDYGVEFLLLIPSNVFIPTPKINSARQTLVNGSGFEQQITYNYDGKSDIGTPINLTLSLVPRRIIFALKNIDNQIADTIISVVPYNATYTDSNNSLYIIIGSVLGFFFVIALLICVFLKFFRTRQDYEIREQRLSQDEQDCPICLLPLDQNIEIIVRTDCFHFFHRDCLQQWFKYDHKTCPKCRQIQERASTVVRLQINQQ
ncbi:hypothetical protein pb186bvf_008454 [Paramecium bursaria]